MKKCTKGIAVLLLAAVMTTAAAAEEAAAAEKVLSDAAQYVEDSVKLEALPHTSALVSENIDLDALTDDDAVTKVTVKKTDAESVLNLAFGKKVKAKEFVFSGVDGSASLTLYQSNDGQTWTKASGKVILDREKGMLRLVNQSGTGAWFYRIEMELASEEFTVDSMVIAQAASVAGPIGYRSFASGSVKVEIGK